MGAHIVECASPYSFFFRLVEPFWKAPTSSRSLHRLATLARKQGARALIIDDASQIDSVRAEITTLDEVMGSGGAAEAILLTFLSEIPVNDCIDSVSSKSVIGQCILINYKQNGAGEFETSFIYEAIFRTPSLASTEPLLNNFINCEATYQVSVRERVFEVRGLSYAQQNGVTAVCAHACIRMTMRTLFPDRDPPSAKEINALLGEEQPMEGMRPAQIATVLDSLTGRKTTLIECDGLQPAEYVSALTAAADSGDFSLFIFATGVPENRPNSKSAAPTDQGDDKFPLKADASCDGPAHAEPIEATQDEGESHVVMAFGYTRNSDEWHPQAIPEYGYLGQTSAQYFPASSWVDHIVIHDDNFGPYYTLSTRVLEYDPTVPAIAIIVVPRLATNIDAHVAEDAAAQILAQAAQMFANDAPDNEWFHYMLRYKRPMVLRPVLLSRSMIGWSKYKT